MFGRGPQQGNVTNSESIPQNAGYNGGPPSAEVPRRDLQISQQAEPNTPEVPEARWRICFSDIHGLKPYQIIWFGDTHGPKPYNCLWFGDINGPKLYNQFYMGFATCMGYELMTSRGQAQHGQLEQLMLDRSFAFVCWCRIN